jgi:hypothetical protein
MRINKQIVIYLFLLTMVNSSIYQNSKKQDIYDEKKDINSKTSKGIDYKKSSTKQEEIKDMEWIKIQKEVSSTISNIEDVVGINKKQVSLIDIQNQLFSRVQDLLKNIPKLEKQIADQELHINKLKKEKEELIKYSLINYSIKIDHQHEIHMNNLNKHKEELDISIKNFQHGIKKLQEENSNSHEEVKNDINNKRKLYGRKELLEEKEKDIIYIQKEIISEQENNKQIIQELNQKRLNLMKAYEEHKLEFEKLKIKSLDLKEEK